MSKLMGVAVGDVLGRLDVLERVVSNIEGRIDGLVKELERLSTIADNASAQVGRLLEAVDQE